MNEDNVGARRAVELSVREDRIVTIAASDLDDRLLLEWAEGEAVNGTIDRKSVV